MYKIKNTKSILNEWRNFLNKNSLLKEEYDPSTGKLTLYHLTGLDKFRQYNPNVIRHNKIIDDWQPDQYLGDPSNRSSHTMHRLRNQKPKQMSDAEIVASSLKALIGNPFTDGTGFTPGRGAMYGPALYTCYEFNPDIIHTYGDIAIKFETNVNGFLIFFNDVAKQVYGEKSDLYGQIEHLLKGKIKNDIYQIILSECSKIDIGFNKNMSNKSVMTSDNALKVSKILFKYLTENQIKRYIKGLIFRGRRDGPVCVVYNPERDVNIVELGKVEINPVDSSTNIIWRDNLTAFVDLYKKEDDDYIPTDDISFERMNQLEREDQSIDYFENITSLNEILNRYIELMNNNSTNKNELSNQFFDLFTLRDFFLLDKKLITLASKYLIIKENKTQELKYDFDIDETNVDSVIILLENIPNTSSNSIFKQQLFTTFNNTKIYKYYSEYNLEQFKTTYDKMHTEEDFVNFATVSNELSLILNHTEDMRIFDFVLQTNIKDFLIKLIQCKRTPQHILYKLSNYSDGHIIYNILDNISLIQDKDLQQELLEKHSSDTRPSIINVILNNIDLIQDKDLKQEILEKYTNSNIDFATRLRFIYHLDHIVKDTEIRQRLLKIFLNDEDERIVLRSIEKIELINDTAFREKIFEKYSNSTNTYIICAILDKIDLIQNKELQQEILERYSNSSDKTILSVLLQHVDIIENKELQLSIIEKFSNDEDESLRSIIASSKNCPKYILKKLINDKDIVKYSIINNPNCDIELLTILSKSTNKNIKKALILHPNCTFDLCNKIISEFDLKTKKEIIKPHFFNFDLNYKNVLNILSNDTEPSIRFLVAKHSDCTKQIAIKLSNDLDQKVKKAALKRLKLNDLKENFNLLCSYLKLLIN